MRPVAMVLAALACSAALSKADAAPPTVTPSPGYDARLKEERAARSAEPRYEALRKPRSARIPRGSAIITTSADADHAKMIAPVRRSVALPR
jgi:hypothetical protein